MRVGWGIGVVGGSLLSINALAARGGSAEERHPLHRRRPRARAGEGVRLLLQRRGGAVQLRAVPQLRLDDAQQLLRRRYRLRRQRHGAGDRVQGQRRRGQRRARRRADPRRAAQRRPRPPHAARAVQVRRQEHRPGHHVVHDRRDARRVRRARRDPLGQRRHRRATTSARRGPTSCSAAAPPDSTPPPPPPPATASSPTARSSSRSTPTTTTAAAGIFGSGGFGYAYDQSVGTSTFYNANPFLHEMTTTALDILEEGQRRVLPDGRERADRFVGPPRDQRHEQGRTQHLRGPRARAGRAEGGRLRGGKPGHADPAHRRPRDRRVHRQRQRRPRQLPVRHQRHDQSQRRLGAGLRDGKKRRPRHRSPRQHRHPRHRDRRPPPSRSRSPAARLFGRARTATRRAHDTQVRADAPTTPGGAAATLVVDLDDNTATRQPARPGRHPLRRHHRRRRRHPRRRADPLRQAHRPHRQRHERRHARHARGPPAARRVRRRDDHVEQRRPRRRQWVQPRTTSPPRSTTTTSRRPSRSFPRRRSTPWSASTSPRP